MHRYLGWAMLLACVLTGTNTIRPLSQVAAASHSTLSRVLYRAVLVRGSADWMPTTRNRWQTRDRTLVAHGPDGAAILAPFALKPGTNYAIEATIRAQPGFDAFGILVRARYRSNFTAGLAAGVMHGVVDTKVKATLADSRFFDGGDSYATLNNRPFPVTDGWHNFRVTVRGNNYRLYIDGQYLAGESMSDYRTYTRVGLFEIRSRVEVSSFRVVGI